MSEKYRSKGDSASNILNGTLIMIIAATIFFFTSTAITILTLLFSLVLILSGMGRIINSFTNDALKNSGIIIKFISGILLIIISIIMIFVVLIEPSLTIATVVLIISISLLVIAIARLLTGIFGANYHTWFRILVIIVGIVIAILMLLVFLLPLEDSLIFSFFSVSLFLSGFTRFLLGFTGQEKYKTK